MNELIYGLIALFVISLSINAYLVFEKLKAKLEIQKLAAAVEAEKKKPTESVELKEFLTDLLAGHALVRVSRIDSADMVLRSRQ